MAARVKVFFDGGCRTGSSRMELAVVIGGRSFVERDLGPGTSMDAEWLALIHAVRLARALGVSDPVLLGDAKAVIAQANGIVRCPAPYLRHLEALRALEEQAGHCRIRYLKRSQNLAGIELERIRNR